MKTWFDEKRMEMLNSACEQVLSPQIQGPLSFAEIVQLAGLLESHNNESVRKNAVGDLSQHNIDIDAELRLALVADAVADFDNKTIGNFTWGAEKEHVMDLSKDSNGEETPAAYVGDRLAVISEKIKRIIDYFPEDGKSFILCTPLMLSVFQSAAKAKYVATLENKKAFKGPNGIALVGSLDKTPLYSYLPNYQFGASSNDDDMIIIGNYQETKDGATTQRLIVKNLSLG